MSSILLLKNQPRKDDIFALIFAHFSLQNHNILWLVWLIYRFDHNVSSELYSQRATTRLD